MDTESRPKLTIALLPIDKVMEFLGWLTLGLLWGFTLFNYSTLPDNIPTHFNAAGQADSYGSKGTIFILPIIGTVLFIGLTVLNMFPHIFNYPKNITVENAQRQYSNAMRMLRFLKFAIVAIFFLLVYLTSQAAAVGGKGIGLWALPLILGLIFIPLIFFIIKSFKST